jgi:hypothetical protein
MGRDGLLWNALHATRAVPKDYAKNFSAYAETASIHSSIAPKGVHVGAIRTRARDVLAALPQANGANACRHGMPSSQ